MLCYRCGSHVQDDADKCWNCGTRLASTAKGSLSELRDKQRTKSRLGGVVYKIGDRIGTRYQVQDIQGSGGVGVVYRAHDQEIDVDVAIKVINAKLLQTGEEKRLFARETKIARKLSHQNIVRIYDEGRDGERAFFTMQYLEGLPLRQIIDLRKNKGQRFSLAEIEPILNQICQALDYAHRTTFHGCLKPDNVIVLPDLLKITDFGLVRGLPRKPFLAIQKSRGPNFHYLAPEVRLEVPELSAQIDVYSLGVIVWEMLTGNVYEDAKPEQLNLANSNVDPSLMKIVRRSLARVAKERYATAGELYEDVRALMAKVGDVSVSPSAAPPTGASVSAPAPAPAVDEASPPDLSSSNPAEAPTQRLDISEHGERPVGDGAGGAAEVKRDELRQRLAAGRQGAPPPPPGQSTLESPLGPEGRELTGAYESIEDDMIESASRSAPPEMGPSAALGPPPEIDAAEEIDPNAEPSEEDEATEAWDAPPLEGLEPRDIAELDELSASEIELVADPKATHVLDMEPEQIEALRAAAAMKPKNAVFVADEDAPSNGAGKKSAAASEALAAAAAAADELASAPDDAVVEAGGQAARARTSSEERPLGGRVIVDLAKDVQLPDSAIPEPAFARVGASDDTKAGRLDGGRGSLAQAATPTMPVDRRGKPSDPPVVRGAPADDEDGAEVEAPASEDRTERRIPSPKRPPVGRGGKGPSAPAPAGKRKAKMRPATRPRMAAISVDPEPRIIDMPSERPSQRPAPVPVPLASEPPPPPPPADRSQNRLMMVMLFSLVAVVIAAMLFMYRMYTDNQRAQAELAAKMAALDARDTRVRKDEETAAAAQEQATRDHAEAEKAEAEQRAAAEAEKKKREEAEREAVAAAERARNDKDTKARDEAERKRKEADAAAAREREALDKAEREKARKERLAAEREAAAARRERAAEEKRRLSEEREALAAKRAAAAEERKAREAELAEKRREDADRRREESERKKREAAERAEAEKARREEAAAKKAEEERKAKEAELAAASKPKDQCPKGMTFVEAGSFMMGAPRNDPERNFGDLAYASKDVAGFCVDYYESPNGLGRTPSAGVTQAAAEKMCAARSKRLCSEEEWEKACKGPAGLRYPYGNQWNPASCGTEDDEGNDRTVTKSGTYRSCRSGFKAYDMAGNVAEWTSSKSGEKYVIKGGSADRPGYDSRCAARKLKQKSYSSETVGFRCCADPI